MARGRDAHRAAEQAVAALGKVLSRRAGSECELCGQSQGCRPALVPPADEPDVDDAILACERCREALTGKKLPGQPSDYRFLETAVWSETAPAQVAAVRLLRRLAANGVEWASETNDGLWLDEAIETRVEAT